ncbi:uncharacterized protein EV420DRAFT_1638123 [Desarmillaria tabescens]|uniref:Uncharacterized protein n=1 Tax=Armillaria tabescens TaxID=1929756 RepID=A0AA39NFL9_ARMTA|nr:uncharacterized protein EV420DRAFT_1638123 [Desarmillaria tabescens]KAK0464573.1 hypothetical protein EV420DRAFT_1638123 [Desarmillaria tabescens]
MRLFTRSSKSKSQIPPVITADNLVTVVPPKRRSIFRTKKSEPRIHIPVQDPAITERQLEVVMSLHPLSDYSRYPSESFPNRGKRSRDSSASVSSASSLSSLSRTSSPVPLPSALPYKKRSSRLHL